MTEDWTKTVWLDIENPYAGEQQWALAAEPLPVNHVVQERLLRDVDFGRRHSRMALHADKLGLSVDAYEALAIQLEPRAVQGAILDLGLPVTTHPVANLEPSDLFATPESHPLVVMDDQHSGTGPAPKPNRAARRAAARGKR